MSLEGRLKRLDEVASLKDKWYDDIDGKAISTAAVSRARNFLYLEPAIFPSLEGDVRFEYVLADGFLSITFTETDVYAEFVRSRVV